MASDARIFDWICDNPGVDDEDVAEHFGIDVWLASEAVERLLNEGLIEHAGLRVVRRG